MTMGPEEIQYRLDVLDVVHPCTLFSWPAKRHGALPARSTIILVMVHRGPTITTFKALFCWGIAIVVVNKLFGWEIREYACCLYHCRPTHFYILTLL